MRCWKHLENSGKDFTINTCIKILNGKEIKRISLHDFLEKEKLRLKKRVGVELTSSAYKTILAPAFESRILELDPFRQIRLKCRPITIDYLTQEEIEKIEKPGLLSQTSLIITLHIPDHPLQKPLNGVL